MRHQTILKQVNDWRKSIIQYAQFKVRPINISESKQWKIHRGVIQHLSGRFFRVVGVRGLINGKQVTQPLIEQREIGTLGFLIYKNKSSLKILVQAKIEPGNIDACQLAPTFQATASNSARAHGGTAPAYKDIFFSKQANVLYSTLNSEQGSRFLGKLNRNIIVISKDLVEPTRYHRWLDLDDFLKLLAEDHLVNTDARSVIVCAPWQKILNRTPFTRYKNGFAKDLYASYILTRPKVIKQVQKELQEKRGQIPEAKPTNLNKLLNWKLTSVGIRSASGQPFSIGHIKVTARGREVTTWDQPILNSTSDGQVILLCVRREGTLYFLICMQQEAGLLNKVELGPSVVCQPGSTQDFVEFEQGKVRQSVFQSDEGGRFFRDVTLYQVVQVSDTKKIDIDGHWLSLGEICLLLQKGGYFTNEARSVFSLLFTCI